MKFHKVALSALAISLASAPLPAFADDHDASAEADYPRTPQGASDFIDAAEEETFAYWLESAKINWVNST